MKIFISGASGVGKSTIVNELKKLEQFKDYVVVPSARQKMIDLGLNHSKDSNETTQELYFNHYLEYLNNDNVIFDRFFIDVLAYDYYLHENNKISKNFYENQVNSFVKILPTIKNYKYYFIEPEFDIVNDGFRELDKEFQKQISDEIDFLLNSFDINYQVLTGSIEERINQVLTSL